MDSDKLAHILYGYIGPHADLFRVITAKDPEGVDLEDGDVHLATKEFPYLTVSLVQGTVLVTTISFTKSMPEVRTLIEVSLTDPDGFARVRNAIAAALAADEAVILPIKQSKKLTTKLKDFIVKVVYSLLPW